MSADAPSQEKAKPVHVLHLNAFEIECAVCDGRWSYSSEGPSFGVPMYEDDILPDDDPGEWGGKPVCPRCYFVVVGMLAIFKRRVTIQEVMKTLKARGQDVE